MNNHKRETEGVRAWGGLSAGSAAGFRLATSGRALLLIILTVAFLVPVAAQRIRPTERSVLETLFRDGAEAVEYTDQFLQAVPPAAMAQHLQSIRGQIGEYVAVEGESNPYTVRHARGAVTTHVAITSDGALAGIRFTQITKTGESLNDAVTSFLDLPGQTSLTIRKDGETLVKAGEAEPLAVGSSFKLAVLRAVEVAIERGQLSWDTVLTVDRDQASLPSGVLQSWPDDSPVTVQTAAILMISQSDNTATDMLIREVGRGAVERHAMDSRPLLTTREFFLLKSEEQSQDRIAFLRGSTDERREVLADLEGELPPASLFAGEPVHPEIEWYFRTEDLARLIEEIERVDILGINPGPVEPSQWEEYGYKGGSEPGVMNMTVRLMSSEGEEYSVSATQNRRDGTINTQVFTAALQSVIARLR